MNYNYTDDTLYVRGGFRAASTGISGGIREVTTLLNHTVSNDFDHNNPDSYIRELLHERRYVSNGFGLLTSVSMRDLCIVEYDYITVFVTAGVLNANPDPRKPHTINIIVTSGEGLSDAALLETIITATEASDVILPERHPMRLSLLRKVR